MEGKKSPKSRKRNAKGIVITPAPSSSTTEEHFWDCSVCTYTNNAEAFKCSMCDVRKGTSTRKPKINPDLVASQLAQALTPPPPPITPTPSCSNSVQGDEDPYEFDDETTVLSTLKVNNKKNREQKSTKKKEPGSSKKSAANGLVRLKNVDRSSATYHSVTVNDFTVVITEFKQKVKKEKKNKTSDSILNENSSRASHSTSASCDGMISDENSRPNGNGNQISINTSSSMETNTGF